MLKVGGKWLSPVEVENALLQHPAVREAAVIGFKDKDGLEKPQGLRRAARRRSARRASAGGGAEGARARARSPPFKAPRAGGVRRRAAHAATAARCSSRSCAHERRTSIRTRASSPWPQVKALADRGRGGAGAGRLHRGARPAPAAGVDVVIAEEVCRRVGARLSQRGEQARDLPRRPYGLTEFAAVLRRDGERDAEGFAALPRGRAGGDRRTRLHAHGRAQPPPRAGALRPGARAAEAAARRSGARVVVPDHRRRPIGPRLGEEFMHGGSHAGGYETSLMMAAAPQLVDEAARRALPELAGGPPGEDQGRREGLPRVRRDRGLLRLARLGHRRRGRAAAARSSPRPPKRPWCPFLVQLSDGSSRLDPIVIRSPSTSHSNVSRGAGSGWGARLGVEDAAVHRTMASAREGSVRAARLGSAGPRDLGGHALHPLRPGPDALAPAALPARPQRRPLGGVLQGGARRPSRLRGRAAGDDRLLLRLHPAVRGAGLPRRRDGERLLPGGRSAVPGGADRAAHPDEPLRAGAGAALPAAGPDAGAPALTRRAA